MLSFSTHFRRRLTGFAAFLLLSFPAFSQLVINEYSAANLLTVMDDYGKHEDWIEIYNPGQTALDLGGYFLSDNPDEPQKWAFPAGTIIAADGYRLVWASGRGQSSAAGLHAGFKLTQTKSNAEHLVLSDPAGVKVDEVTMKKTQANQSRGRATDGNVTFGIFTNPTPGQSNDSESAYSAYADRPDFSVDAGFYTDSVVVEIVNNEPGAIIHYTLDGKAPKTTSPIYDGPLTIKQTTVLKAAAFSPDPGVLPGFMEYATYFINEHHSVVVVSIAGNQLDQLANGSQNLIPTGSVEYFDKNGLRTTRSYGQYNSHGQDSWVNDQRSLDLVCRDEMGYSKALKEKIFALSDRDEFQRLILRAAGDDNYPGNFLPQHTGCAHLRDAYVHNLARRGGLHLDVRLSEKAVVYLNGKYWGVYDLREIPDDHDYTEYYHGQDKYNLQYLLTWGNTWAEYGDQKAFDDWQPLQDYILAADMTNQANFDYAASQLDVESLTDYVITNSLTVCSDWLNWNTGWWRGLNPAGDHRKWGYILWDNDATFGYYINYTGIADTSATAAPCNAEALAGTDTVFYSEIHQIVQDSFTWGGHHYAPGDTLFIPGGWNLDGGNADLNNHMQMLMKLRQNPGFNRYYLSRYVDLMNTVFSCENMLSYLDTVAGIIAPEMERHTQRWGGTYADWQENVARLRYFIERRCEAQYNGMADCYNLTGPYDVTFQTDPPNLGPLQINSLTISDLPYTGHYFGDLGVQLQAPAPSPGADLAFEKWSADDGSFFQQETAPGTLLLVAGADNITAHFSLVSGVKDPTGVPVVQVLAYPTLFKNQLTVEYELPVAAPVSIQLSAADGRSIATLANEVRPVAVGRYTVTLNLNTDLPVGAYVLQFKAGNYQQHIPVVKAN